MIYSLVYQRINNTHDAHKDRDDIITFKPQTTIFQNNTLQCNKQAHVDK